MTRIRDLHIGQEFVLKRTGDRYQFLGHKRDTPGGTRYVVRRSGFASPTTLHHSCHIEILGVPMDALPAAIRARKDSA